MNPRRPVHLLNTFARTKVNGFNRLMGLIGLIALMGTISSLGACNDAQAPGWTMPSAPVCEYEGQAYQAGELFSDIDGCNTCTCNTDGAVACTAIACSAEPCTEAMCGERPNLPNQSCDDGSSAGLGDCERQDNGDCGWSVTECPDAPADPCADKACGEPCTQALACDSVCDAQGQCVCDTGDEPLCAGDLCAEVTCPSTPAYCEDDVAYSAASSSCDPNTGECLPSPGAPPQDCAAEGLSCQDGACIDACADVACDTGYLCDNGECVVDPAPCADKACGDPCPWILNCVSVCDAQGECVCDDDDPSTNLLCIRGIY